VSAPGLRLVTRWQNSAGERVRIALNLKGLAYDYVAVGALDAGTYSQINPQGLLPALLIGNEVIAQSTAILEYIEETHPEPALLPADPLPRAQARAFAQLITSDLHPINNARVRRFLEHDLHVDAAGVQDWYTHWLRVSFEALEETLRRRTAPWPFCFGEAPGWADLHLVPQMANARRFDCDLEPYPHLRAIDARCRDLTAFHRARPEQQPDFPPAEPN
jgi:maleylacetoacetate isomerase